MMKRHSNTLYGKAFLWLIAIAVSLLIEGFLLSSTEKDESLTSLVNFQELPTALPEASVHVDRVVEFVNFMVGLFQVAT